jgi:flavin reductase (DIM6/NTAB) family NADH-FMN oxidoreductase RutF
MSKKELKLHSVVAPTQTVIVSAYDEEGRADACTLAFYMVSSHVPPCVTVAINATAKRKTLQSILASNAFVLGFPSSGQVKETDYLGVESGYNADKLNNIGFTVSEARTVHAPVINELLLSLECEVVHTVTVGSHTQITGEVKNILAEESILNEKDKILLDRLQPLIYDEEEFAYLGIGPKIADAFKTGAEVRKMLTVNEGNIKTVRA